jgi:hypothetical protein
VLAIPFGRPGNNSSLGGNIFFGNTVTKFRPGVLSLKTLSYNLVGLIALKF